MNLYRHARITLARHRRPSREAPAPNASVMDDPGLSWMVVDDLVDGMRDDHRERIAASRTMHSVSLRVREGFVAYSVGESATWDPFAVVRAQRKVMWFGRDRALLPRAFLHRVVIQFEGVEPISREAFVARYGYFKRDRWNSVVPDESGYDGFSWEPAVHRGA